jgi:hypothetical protein
MLRFVACSVAAALLLVMVAPSASALSASPITVVYSHVAYCVKASAAIDHFTGGFSGNIGYANAYLASRSFTGSCNGATTGWGRARLDVQVWNDSIGTWVFCRGSDWRYGQFGWSGGELGGPYGPQQLLDYGGAVCGPNYYRTVATAEYNVSGSTWVGGSISSPWEFVP